MSVPTDTPSTDGAPDPEEVLIGVLADMFEPWEPASPRTIAFSKMLRAKLDERGVRLARVVPGRHLLSAVGDAARSGGAT